MFCGFLFSGFWLVSIGVLNRVETAFSLAEAILAAVRSCTLPAGAEFYRIILSLEMQSERHGARRVSKPNASS